MWLCEKKYNILLVHIKYEYKKYIKLVYTWFRREKWFYKFYCIFNKVSYFTVLEP